LPGSENWGVEPENQKGLLHTEKDGKVVREYIPSLKGNYGEYYDAMYEAIRNNKPLPVTAEDGRNVIRIIEGAYQSNKEKKTVKI
jgi:predicted dehydrogenase